ncbi:Putative phosphoserine phosphatase 2 [Roseovarius albus]|uniref:Putative phosphoserine phosphatase 2 n=1 Tax=Roseovarius albus TaxID=1247867 RepID=A0A1X6Z960_9RHOB|nr:histidine phosphatase family protein [Roseovarius albus]SLN42510.1 Putative phosphoserine phosphatase 2 [Roseovarius albus]
MTRLFLVRHGPTHAKSMVGWSDIPADLSDTAQIARLDAFIPKDAIVISSDLIRASATADAITGERTRLPHDPNLREINFGDWELQQFDAIEDQDHIRQYWDYPGDIRPPNGESWNEVSERVTHAVDGLMRSYPGSDFIIVAHFGAILTQVQHALRITAYETFSHRIDNLSVTELHLVDRKWHAERINHLP